MNANRMADRIASLMLWLAGVTILCVLAWLLWRILAGGLPHVSFRFLFGRPREIQVGGGIGPQLFNSFYILFLSLAFSLPIGFAAGIYLAMYARQNRFTSFIRVSIESLSSIPSIVFGLFGLLVFVNWMQFKFSILSGALTLALLHLPVLVSVTETSLRAVPVSYFEASLALGSTKWQAIRKALIPAALPNLVTGVTLAAGRALGESAALIYTAGLSVSRRFPDFDPMSAGETLAVHLWYVQAESVVPDAKQIAQGSAAVLVLVVLLFNLLIAVPSRLLQKRLSGGK